MSAAHFWFGAVASKACSSTLGTAGPLSSRFARYWRLRHVTPTIPAFFMMGAMPVTAHFKNLLRAAPCRFADCRRRHHWLREARQFSPSGSCSLALDGLHGGSVRRRTALIDTEQRAHHAHQECIAVVLDTAKLHVCSLALSINQPQTPPHFLRNRAPVSPVAAHGEAPQSLLRSLRIRGPPCSQCCSYRAPTSTALPAQPQYPSLPGSRICHHLGLDLPRIDGDPGMTRFAAHESIKPDGPRRGDTTHQGKTCCGRTPMETFLDGIEKRRNMNLPGRCVKPPSDGHLPSRTTVRLSLSYYN